MTQRDLILQALKSGSKISALDALVMFNCFRLGARIWELRQKGYNILTVMVTRNGKHYARYEMGE